MKTVFNAQPTPKTGGLALSLNVIIFVIVSLIGSIIRSAVGVNSEIGLYIAYVISPIAIIISLTLLSFNQSCSLKSFLPFKCSPKYYLIGVMIIFGTIFSLGWVNGVTLEFLKLFGYTPRPQESYLPSLDGVQIIPALIIIAVLPAICEEALFRGAILNGVKNGCGDIATILIVGFSFSLFHGNPEQTIYQFICGCLFAFVTVRAGSVLPAMLIHFINNATIIIFSACELLDSQGQLVLSGDVQTALIICGAISLVFAIVWLIFDSRKEIEKAQKNSIKTFFIWALVGIVVLSLTWLLALMGVE